MRVVLASIALFLCVVCMSFFFVFSFHASSPIQHDVKTFLDTGSGVLPFSESANSHMLDVYWVLFVFRIVAAVSVLTLVALHKYLSMRSVRIVGACLVATPIVLALINWDVLFRVFHLVLFPQGNWMFPANSLLIQTYPESFFIFFSSVWALLVVVFGLLCVFSQKMMCALKSC